MFLAKFYSLLILHILSHIETFIGLFQTNLSYFVLAFFVFFFFSFVANIFKNYNYSKSSLFFLFSAFILNFINCFFIKSNIFAVILLYVGFFAIFNRFFVVKTVTILPLFQKQKTLPFILIFLICFLFSAPCLFKNQIKVKTSSVYFKVENDSAPINYKIKEIKFFDKFSFTIKQEK